MKTQKESLGGTAPQGEPELVAERLILLNPDGVARMGNGGVVGLNRLMVCDDNGKIGLDAQVKEDGAPALAFLDKGTIRAGIGIHKGKVMLALCDKEGKIRTSLAVSDEGLPDLSFYDASGARKMLLGVTEAGAGILVMSDHDTAPRLMVSTICNDPTLWVLNKQGKVVWEVAESTLPQTAKNSTKRRTSRRTRQRAATR